MINSREQFNNSVAETIADKFGSDRDSVRRTLTNPIQLSNVTDTAKKMPTDVAQGIVSMLKMPMEVTRNLVNATENAAKGHLGFALNELGRGTRTLLFRQFAPISNIGKRFASSVRDNQ